MSRSSPVTIQIAGYSAQSERRFHAPIKPITAMTTNTLNIRSAGSKQHSDAAVHQFVIYIADGGWIRDDALFHLDVV
jgi:hypothetical protein